MDEKVVSIQGVGGNGEGADADSAPASATDLQGLLEADDLRISDDEFMWALKRLRRLSTYLLLVAAPFDANVLAAARLGALNRLEDVFPRKGRRATLSEWRSVEEKTQIIWAALPESHRKKFLASQIPGWFTYVTTGLLSLAAAALVYSFLIRSGKAPELPGNLLIPFMLWIAALGAVGGCASIGMNALAVQDDATFDLSVSKFLWLRLMLGALFGIVLTLPFGFSGFQDFLSALQAGPSQTVDPAAATKQAGLLLLPFILGFSTSLVILALNRMIEAVQTLFGKPVDRGVSK